MTLVSGHTTILVALLVPMALLDYAFAIQIIEAAAVEGEILWFLAGLGCGLASNLIFKRSNIWNIFWHELTHVFWAKLFRAEVGTIMVSKRRGGYISHKGTARWGLPLVALAPYFFPMAPLLLSFSRTLVKPIYYQPIAFLVGFTLYIFYYDLFQTLKVPQADFKGIGTTLSVLAVSVMNVFFVCVMIMPLIGTKSFREFFIGAVVFWRNVIPQF